MQKQIILFDWDDTLFNKAEYIKRLTDNLAKAFNTSTEQVTEIEKKYFESLNNSSDFHISRFHIGRYVEYFEQSFNKKIDSESFTTDKLGIYSGALFPETISVLNSLKDNFILGIYSQGDVDCQRIKIKASGIGEFFDEKYTFITTDKSDPDFIKTLPDGAIIIDDKQSKIEPLEKTGRFKLFWINRKDGEIMEGNVTTVKDLNEFVNLV